MHVTVGEMKRFGFRIKELNVGNTKVCSSVDNLCATRDHDFSGCRYYDLPTAEDVGTNIIIMVRPQRLVDVGSRIPNVIVETQIFAVGYVCICSVAAVREEGRNDKSDACRCGNRSTQLDKHTYERTFPDLSNTM